MHQQSWRSAPPAYRKVCPFSSQNFQSSVDFRRAMLWAGMMSVSPRMPQWWTASQWAVLRYFGAVDGSVTALRLHEAIDEIDTHPKKVLSDDWGIGVGIEWLDSQFQYGYVQHGLRAMGELQALGVASLGGKKKRGPQKCPDFICRDRNGRYHLIECKGNQQGVSTTANQFEQGRLQKATVRFSNEQLVAQRMVAGLAIAGCDSKWDTTLTLTDPPPDDPYDETRPHYRIEAEHPERILDALKRAACAQGLLLSGFFDLARRVLPESSDTRGLDEPLSHFPVSEFEANGSEWIGQVFNLPFPATLKIDAKESAAGVRLRFGASRDFIETAKRPSYRLTEPANVEELDLELVPRYPSDDRPAENQTKEASVSIQYGHFFIADLELM